MIKQTILAASILAASNTNAISVYEYDNFTTSLNGFVGVASSYEFRGISLNDQPTIYAGLQLTGIDGTLKGGYIRGAGASINLPESSSQWLFDIGYQSLNEVGFNGGIGYEYNVFSNTRGNDFFDLDSGLDYGEIHGNISYTFDNDYEPLVKGTVAWSDEYFGNYGESLYGELYVGTKIPTIDATVYGTAGYLDSQSDLLSNYANYSIGITGQLGYATTTLQYTWMDSDDQFLITPVGDYGTDNNGTINLRVAYKF